MCDYIEVENFDEIARIEMKITGLREHRRRIEGELAQVNATAIVGALADGIEYAQVTDMVNLICRKEALETMASYIEKVIKQFTREKTEILGQRHTAESVAIRQGAEDRYKIT
jgi:hypothetical protein